jgi:hypothetical protein
MMLELCRSRGAAMPSFKARDIRIIEPVVTVRIWLDVILTS